MRRNLTINAIDLVSANDVFDITAATILSSGNWLHQVYALIYFGHGHHLFLNAALPPAPADARDLR